MTTDHAEFIARHHRKVEPPKEPKTLSLLDAVIATFLVIVYLIICVVVAVKLDVSREAVIVAGFVFIAAAISAYVLQKVFHIRSFREKQLDILREVLEGSRGARLITDNIDGLVYANERFNDLCEGVGKAGLETLTALFKDNEEAMAHFNLLADQAHRGLTDTIELYSSRDDRDTWYTVTAQPVSGWNGYIHWRIDDITQKRNADRAIRDEREKLIDFTDNAPVGFFSVNEEGRFVFVNATLARWLGEDIKTLLSTGKLHTYFSNVPENARPFDIVSDGGAKQMADVVMKGPGGKTFTASISQAVVHEADGVVRTRAVMHDLTAERAMRQALQASEDRFLRLFQEAPLGIALLNRDRKLSDCNPHLALMLGMESHEMEDRYFETLIEEKYRKSALDVLKRIEKGEEIQAPLEIVLLGKEKQITVSMYARLMEGSDDIVVHFIDLTEQKSLEAQFVQSQKMQGIGQLAGGVAHDFNNLLTAMIGFCDLLLLRHKPGDASFSDVMQIKQNASRAANLVRQLLAFSRQQTLRPKVQDISDILTEVSHLIRRLIGINIELELVHGSDIGFVKVDAGQMEQVLINLAVNARDAMDGKGQLTIKTNHVETKEPMERGGDEMPAGDWVLIEVVDSGCGISEENLNRIFEPFFTTKEVGQGTGLGLATVYGIVRQTGGYLHADSTIGEGTTFSVYLPRMSEEDLKNEPEENEEAEDVVRDLTGTARILLVEDEDAVRVFSSRALANKGYEVLDAESGEGALELLENQDIKNLDLLITDVIMPNMDGPALAQRIRQMNSELKILFISGYTEEKLKDHMGENIWFLPKPFTLKQLAAKVKSVLDE
jgi:two-component system cell cycle sensor histidine kinase/response regulator CckA